MQGILALFVGLGLAATCGFRIFVPLLGLSIASHLGYVPLADGFEWIGSRPAMIAFGAATIFEVGAYYMPWLDQLLDALATPAAAMAGALVMVSVLGDLSPQLRWPLAVIAGGGAAGIVQVSTVVVRGASTVATGGFGNPLVSTGELAASIVGTIISIVLPVVAIFLVALLMILILRRALRRRAQAAK